MFELILEGDAMQYCMAAGCDSKDPAESAAIKSLGLVTEHSYGIIRAERVQDKNGDEVELVQLRNPWGKFEWQGDWGDESNCWTP